MPKRFLKSVVGLLILANVAGFALQFALGDAVLVRLALWPLGNHIVPGVADVVGFRPWQLLTSAFLHESPVHIALNMAGLWMFGRAVERALGRRKFLVLYFVSVLTAGVVQLFVTSVWHPQLAYSLGASGGVYGVALSFGMRFAQSRFWLRLLRIPVKVWALILTYGLVELVAGVFGTQQGVGHFAHLGGMLGAFVLMWGWRRRSPPAPRDAPGGERES